MIYSGEQSWNVLLESLRNGNACVGADTPGSLQCCQPNLVEELSINSNMLLISIYKFLITLTLLMGYLVIGNPNI